MKSEDIIPTERFGGCSIMLWLCFAVGGILVRHETDGIMKKECNVKIFRQYLNSVAGKFETS